MGRQPGRAVLPSECGAVYTAWLALREDAAVAGVLVPPLVRLPCVCCRCEASVCLASGTRPCVTR